MRLEASYVLPLRSEAGGPSVELTAYLDWLAQRIDVVVVDGSSPECFTANARHWEGLPIRHVRPDPRLAAANGKVTGVLTGLQLARHDRVVIADDDVRYGPAALDRAVALLDDADLVRPQNYFSPLPWHAAWDTARTLLNRVGGGDYPGTLAVRRRLLLATGGYDGDVLFENLELIRTVRAVGGRTVTPLDLYVARRPPTSRRFWSQRVRQAYDDFAQPCRLMIALTIVPAIGTAIARRDRAAAVATLATVAATIGAAEIGRYRSHGRTVFPAFASLLAPVWLLERGVCSWLAVASRLHHGGCPYAGGIVRRAATPNRILRKAHRERDDSAPLSIPPSAVFFAGRSGRRGETTLEPRRGGPMSMTETGEITGTKDKDYNLIWFTEVCLSNVLRMETYIQDAEREGDQELAEFFRRAQGESRKGADQGKKLLASRLR